MTQMLASAGAPSALLPTWEDIDWPKAVSYVRRLQMRIAKAYREGKHGKVKALQWILTHSFSAKLLAVKRVVQNKGAKTPGIDKVIWRTSGQKIQAVLSLKRRGYRTKPLKRIAIPKKEKGKFRPLSIPVMGCRAQQALYLLSLEPIAEMLADKNAYGFRPLRSTADAIEQCFKSLALKCCAQYILEADIQACFDKISFQWLMENIPIDKEILRKWLTAGYMEKGKLYTTERGTPQGGIISPVILTVALSGLEQAVQAVTSSKDKVNVIVYADDFVITGVTQEVLENKVKPVVEAFLSERGLSLSKEKTTITSIQEGFDFLGMHIRKYKSKLIIKPAKSSVKRLLANIQQIIKSRCSVTQEELIRILNPKIQGWANYYSHVCAKETFCYIDYRIFKAIWRWAVRRHKYPRKGKRWILRRYFHQDKTRSWVFLTKVKKNGITENLCLKEASKTPIKRHIKIRAAATPFDPAYHAYLSKRISERRTHVKRGKKSMWWLCWWDILKPESKVLNSKSRIVNGGLINA